MIICDDSSIYVRSIIKKLFITLRKSFLESPVINQDELLHLSVIGSFPTARRICHIMDFDIVVVVDDPMTRCKYNEVQRIFSDLVNLSDQGVSISSKVLIGPFKPIPLDNVNLFFHVLLFTKKTYIKSPLILSKNSWQYEGVLFHGVELKEIHHIPELTLDELIYGKRGIRNCRKIIENKSISYYEWVGNERMLLRQKLTSITKKNAILESCYYGVLRSASNSLRYILRQTKGIGILYEDMLLFQDVFCQCEFREIPLKMWREKKRLRMDQCYYDDLEVDKCRKISIAFLSDLEHTIINMPRL